MPLLSRSDLERLEQNIDEARRRKYGPPSHVAYVEYATMLRDFYKEAAQGVLNNTLLIHSYKKASQVGAGHVRFTPSAANDGYGTVLFTTGVWVAAIRFQNKQPVLTKYLRRRYHQHQKDGFEYTVDHEPIFSFDPAVSMKSKQKDELLTMLGIYFSTSAKRASSLEKVTV